MFHDKSLATYLEFLRGKMFDNGANYERIVMDSDVLGIARFEAKKLKLTRSADILWIQYCGPRIMYVNPNYDDPSSTNKIASLITNTKERVRA
jgi:hypothetical protein